MKNTFIYALCCPITQEVKYIGKSNNPKERLTKHKSKKAKDNNKPKKDWIKLLLSQNLSPILNILEEVSIDAWKEREKFYIKKYQDLGFKLYNICGGANGLNFGNQTSFNGRNAVRVICLTKKGEYVDTFNSIKLANEFCGAKVWNALSKRTKQAGGYLWLYKDNYDKLSKEELQIFVENCNSSLKGKTGDSINTQFGKKDAWNKGLKGIKLKPNKNIHQYTSDMNFIKTWNTAKEAAINLFGDENREEFLARCARGQSKTSFGYYWTYNKI